MKKLLLLSIVLIVGCVFAQQYKDVIILKNGSEIHGIIIEEKHNEYIIIQWGKNTFVLQFEEIELFKKELVENESHNISEKTTSIAVGFGTNKSLSLFNISKEIFIIGKTSGFLITGVGTTLLGCGLTYQSQPNNNGYNISATLGYFKEDMEFNSWMGRISLNFSLNYQWKTGNRSFISAGIMRGLYGHEKSSCDAYSGCHDIYDEELYLFPTFSYDYRF